MVSFCFNFYNALGFENKRFQEHDDLIAAIVADFNTHKMEYAGCTDIQAEGIPNMTPELFKSFLIQGEDRGPISPRPNFVLSKLSFIYLRSK